MTFSGSNNKSFSEVFLLRLQNDVFPFPCPVFFQRSFLSFPTLPQPDDLSSENLFRLDIYPRLHSGSI